MASITAPRTLKKSFDESENFRARIQGFADHSEEKKQDESQVDREIFKNIQPISVGV